MPMSVMLRNVLLASSCAILGSVTNLVLQRTLREGDCTPYFINVVYDAIGAVITGCLCILQDTGIGRGSWRLLMANSMCLWLYQWASLHALKVLPLAVVAGLNSSINPVFATIGSTLTLGERPTSWFAVVLLRNIVVIWLMVLPLFNASKAGLSPEISVVLGIPWTIVLALSVGASLTVQRYLKTESPMLISFWGLAVNTLLWMPPGLFPHVRVPGLWPRTENDGKAMHQIAWVYLPAASIVGVAASVATTKVLHSMELPSFVTIFGPVLIGMNCLHDILEGNQVSKLTVLGLAVVVGGLVMDVVLNKKMTDAVESDPKSGLGDLEVEIADSHQSEDETLPLLLAGEGENPHKHTS